MAFKHSGDVISVSTAPLGHWTTTRESTIKSISESIWRLNTVQW